jgi:hypothetical protein
MSEHPRTTNGLLTYNDTTELHALRFDVLSKRRVRVVGLSMRQPETPEANTAKHTYLNC